MKKVILSKLSFQIVSVKKVILRNVLQKVISSLLSQEHFGENTRSVHSFLEAKAVCFCESDLHSQGKNYANSHGKTTRLMHLILRYIRDVFGS